jgi:hypothetical protein
LKLTQRQLKALAKAHVDHFRYLLSGDTPGTHRGECEHYLTIWEGVYAKATKASMTSLADDEEAEVQDAIDCGDYDTLLAREVGGGAS